MMQRGNSQGDYQNLRRPRTGQGTTENTASSMYFDQHCTDNNFHKVSSGSSNGDEDDFAQTYCGEESGRGTKADNKYSQKAIGKDAQTTSFVESKHKFKAFCRDQWARASSDSRLSSQRDKDHVQLKPHSLEPSERTQVNTDYQQHQPAAYSNIVGEPRIVSHARLSNSLNNSNSLISGSGQAGGPGTVNFSQTVNELSAILPPKHNNNSKMKRGTSLRGNHIPQAQISTAINVFNDYTTASIDDPSRHILSREVDDEGQMILQDFSAADGLQSSYARRCQESAAAANQSNILVARPTNYNPFRSKSTPPLPMQSSNSADLNRINFLPGGPPSRQHSSTSNTMEQQDTSNFMLRKTSSGQILQGKQSRQIEELEKVISEKMGMIKQIDHMIQVNQVKKQTQHQRNTRAHSTPQLPVNRTHPTESPLKSTISPPPHDKQNYNRRPNQHRGPSNNAASKSKSRGKEISQSKLVLLQKKKNRYKAKLISLRQHATMQEQQILRLSQNLTGVESQACTVRNENEQIGNQLIQLQKEFAHQSQEMTIQQAELQSAEQLIQQLKLQMNQRGDTLLEIKHEHTDLQINNRQLIAELQDKDHELQAMQEDFQKAMQENQAFSDKYKEQEQALAELRDVNLYTQDEFDAFRADMETKNDLIGQLKEQIKEITDDHFKEKEKAKRTTEIDQLKELIAQMTTQMLDRSKKDRTTKADSSKLFSKGKTSANQISDLYPTLGLQQTQKHLEQENESEADCTEAEDININQNQDQDADYSEITHQDQRNTFKKFQAHHLRAVSCATQTELFTSQEICSCCQPADEPLANHHLHDSCCQFSQEHQIIQSPQSLNHNHCRSGKSEDRLPLHDNHHMRFQQHHQRTNSKNNVKADSSSNVRGNHGDKVTVNPYKRRSSSVQSPASSNSRCCSKNSQTSRSPVHKTTCQCQQTVVKNQTQKTVKRRKDKSPSTTKLLSLQVQKQQDLDRIKELEGFCTELVKQVEHWRRLDKSGRLINSRIEEHLINHQMPVLAATGPMAPQAASQTIFSQ